MVRCRAIVMGLPGFLVCLTCSALPFWHRHRNSDRAKLLFRAPGVRVACSSRVCQQPFLKCLSITRLSIDRLFTAKTGATMLLHLIVRDSLPRQGKG